MTVKQQFVEDMNPGTVFEIPDPLGNGVTQFIKISPSGNYNVINTASWKPGYIANGQPVVALGVVSIARFPHKE